MTKTVTCLFSSEAQASPVVHRLEDGGIDRGNICLLSNTGTSQLWDNTPGFDEQSKNISDETISRYLQDNGVLSGDAHAYAEGVRRGNALVAVRCDDNEVDRVVSILDRDDALDIDERQTAWRTEGWTGYGAGLAGTADSATTARASMMDDGDIRDRSTPATGEREEVIPVAEEDLNVGKREVGRGRVRIVSHIVERPAQEQVTLREEQVNVERRPVEGTTRSGAMSNDDLFRERSIEMEERAEEAVVSKEARVTEEVAVRKDVDTRTETISDTVRKTEVEIEDERNNRSSRTGTTDDRR
ncbi:YsnF/AvaK domain-containing protein [Microvirga sp. TS319]|uniref:YsnF/AvaK domain-containing protein n=1 Tax=Microvirga sp. TS319 TaxID=3241165 RepID=UPI003519DF35